MMLLIDVGNTRLKWAFLTNDKFEYGGAIGYTQSNFLELLSSVWSGITKPKKVMVANVAGENISDLLKQWFKEQFNCKVHFLLAKKEQLGMVNAYKKPDQLGVDRWMAMLAIWHEIKQGFCLVSCGTAITFDVVDQEGAHKGGLILPGIDMMQSVLIERLSGLSQVTAHDKLPDSLLANNTYHAVSGGCIYACIAFINQLTADVTHELGNDIHCFITGGNAHLLLPMLQSDYQYKSHLVLHGLSLLTG